MARFWLKKEEGAISQGIEWPLEAGESKEMGSPPEPLGEHIPASTLLVAHWTRVRLLHNCKIVNLGHLKRVRVCGYLLQQKKKESERKCETVRVAPHPGSYRDSSLNPPHPPPDQDSLTPSSPAPDWDSSPSSPQPHSGQRLGTMVSPDP